MRRGRLPLTGLRSFEAAGRQLSFTKAAEELFVSQAAISRQVRELEALLGLKLFERRHRQVVLTEAGTRLLAALSGQFDVLEALLAELRAAPPARVLHVSAEPGFASCWLIQRLEKFRALRPDLDVAINPDSRPVAFTRDGPALAIRWSAGQTSWPGAQAEHLMDDCMTPVLAPSLRAAGVPLAAPADLARHTLLHEEKRGYWAEWFAAAGISGPVAARGPLYMNTALTVQAALRGQGVALADPDLVRDDLAAGRLVRPFALSIPCGAYWLLRPAKAPPDQEAASFAAWLRAELAAG